MSRGGGDRGGDRGASQVISVVLMVAVSIVLAAMVGTVLLNIVTDIDTDPVAAAGVTFDDANDSVSVVYTTAQTDNATLTVNLYYSSNATAVDGSPATLTSVGQQVTFEGLEDGTAYRVVVVAKAGDDEALIADRTGTV